MIRQGDCNNCGWCCQFLSVQRITIGEKDVTSDIERFYKLRNGVLCEDGKIRFTVHLFIPCDAHDNSNKRCKDYANRPEVCKAFPSMPEQIEGTPCSYWFECEDGGKRGGLGSSPRFGR